MSAPGRFMRGAVITLGVLGAVGALAWSLARIMPRSYAGLFSLVVVGLAVTEVIKRQPRYRAQRALRIYLRARKDGADEQGARARLLARQDQHPETRRNLCRAIEAQWTGHSEKTRVISGVQALLAHTGAAVDTPVLSAVYDRIRDRYIISGWDALPEGFVAELRRRLDTTEFTVLDTLAEKYHLHQQKFFRRPTALGTDPATSVAAFSRLLQSLGNRLVEVAPGDAQSAYRVSLRLRPEENLAHASLAVLFERLGRKAEAVREAKAGLTVLDLYTHRAADRAPPLVDISPFRSPDDLRQTLERILATGAEQTRE